MKIVTSKSKVLHTTNNIISWTAIFKLSYISLADALLARVESEKIMSLIKAWEDSEKTRAENK